MSSVVNIGTSQPPQEGGVPHARELEVLSCWMVLRFLLGADPPTGDSLVLDRHALQAEVRSPTRCFVGAESGVWLSAVWMQAVFTRSGPQACFGSLSKPTETWSTCKLIHMGFVRRGWVTMDRLEKRALRSLWLQGRS